MFVKQVFDDALFNQYDLDKSLTKICENRTNTWRDHLIICPDLIRYCSQGFIRLMNENDIILLGASQMNHWHAEMYTFFLWKQYIEPQKKKLKIFDDMCYHYVKSSDEGAYISLGSFCYARIYYEANIYYCGNEELPNAYELKLLKSRGESTPDKYNDNIRKVLKNLHFEWNEEHNGYYLKCDNSDVLMKRVEQLNEAIQGL